MKEKAQTGRPRGFDREKALAVAMHVFWARGYEGASLQELTEAMGINKPSMYAAFGDKQSLFRQAYERYISTEMGFFAEALAKKTAREVAETYLRGMIRLATSTEHGGCLVTNGALAVSPDGDETKAWLAERRLRGEGRLKERMQRAVQEGDLPKGTNCNALAKLLSSLGQGFNVQGASGVSARELNASAKLALASLPLG